MYLCYIDESGTPDIPGNTTHFILAGLSIPIDKWKDCDREISVLKLKHSLPGVEIHTAYMMRRYIEQSRIKNFETFGKRQRIYEVEKLRNLELLRLQRSGNYKQYKLSKKTF